MKHERIAFVMAFVGIAALSAIAEPQGTPQPPAQKVAFDLSHGSSRMCLSIRPSTITSCRDIARSAPNSGPSMRNCAAASRR